MHNQYKYFRLTIIVLTIASVIPFFLYPALVEVFHHDPAIMLAPYLSYNNIIISFMCGVVWGNTKSARDIPENIKILFIILSPVIMLTSWLAFNLFEANIQLMTSAVLFLVLLLLDLVLHRHAHLPRWYYLLRFTTTMLILVIILYSLRYV